MFEVIVERPRLRIPRRNGSSYPRGALRQRFERDLGAAPARLGMSFPHREKWLNENLAPLRRFLASRVGRPWDRVRSEIAAHLSVRSAVQKHVLDHLEDFVAEHVTLFGGAPHAFRWGTLVPLGRTPHPALYVCPRTGLLRAARRPGRREVPGPERVAVLDRQREVWRVGGALVTVIFRRLPAQPAERDRCFDVLLGARLGARWFDPSDRFRRFYGQAERFAVETREPGLRELARARRVTAR